MPNKNDKRTINEVKAWNPERQKTKILLEGPNLEGTQWIGELDSGSGVNIVPLNIAKEKKMKIVNSNKEILRTGTGGKINVHGTANVDLYFGGKTVTVNFVVSSNYEWTIISFSAMSEIGRTVIDSGKEELTIGGTKWIKFKNEDYYRSRTITSEQLLGNNLHQILEKEEKDIEVLEEGITTLEDFLEEGKLHKKVTRKECDINLTKEQDLKLSKLIKSLENRSSGPAPLEEGSKELDESIFFSIETDDEKFFKQKRRRMTKVNAQAAQEMISKLLKKNMISEISGKDALCVSNLVFPRKKNGEIRVAVDFTDLNKITKTDNSYIPSVEEIMQELDSKSKFFCNIDLKSGFWHIPILHKDRGRQLSKVSRAENFTAGT